MQAAGTRLHLYLSGILFGGAIAVVFLLPLHELAELVLDEEGGVELAHGHLII